MKGDFLVDTPNPKAVDVVLHQLGAVLIGGPNFIVHEGHYVVRPFANPDFVRFAVDHQGYAKVVGDPPDPAPWDVTVRSLTSPPWPATVWDVLNLIVAEWDSDPTSVQCFDLRLVDRARVLLKHQRSLFQHMERAGADYIYSDMFGDRWRLRPTGLNDLPLTIEILERQSAR